MFFLTPPAEEHAMCADRAAVLDVIVNKIAEYQGMPPEKITEETRFSGKNSGELDISSMQFLTILDDLERTLGLSTFRTKFSAAELHDKTREAPTVGALCDDLCKRLGICESPNDMVPA